MARKLAVLLLVVLAGCSAERPGLDLLNAGERIKKGVVAGRGKAWIVGQGTKTTLRIGDALRRGLPAIPPSRIVYGVDIAKGSHLRFACGIAAERHDQPGVEFTVKVARSGREETVYTQLIDPANRPEHRHWVPADVDLSAWAGKDADLILETRGYESVSDPRSVVWGSPVLTPARDAAPLTVVYLVDTLRADHTSVYGYARDTTPELARFAKDGVVFENAVAQSSWTKPSVASVLTSLLPAQHGTVHLRDTLPLKLVTLGERLQDKGISTGAIVANEVIYTAGSHFEQGFDVFTGIHDPEDKTTNRATAGAVVDAALAWVDGRQGLPGFLYVHTMDPHIPYDPPPPFNMKYEPHPTPEHPGQDPRDESKSARGRDYYVAQYDGEIAYSDQEFGRFIRELKARGLYERALIVFMADHGEEFADHGSWGHGTGLYDELVRIPLVVKFPGGRGAGSRVAPQVQELDVAPTVLTALGVPVPGTPEIEGKALQAVLTGTLAPRAAVMEVSHRAVVAHGIRTNSDKYIRRFSPQSDELYYDLQKDPGEKRNVVERARERVRTLRAAVEPSLLPNPFRNVVHLVGSGDYRLTVATSGWIHDLQSTGFGEGEMTLLDAATSKISIHARPRPGQPREFSFVVRPRGTRAWLEGSVSGRPLDPRSVFIGEDLVAPVKDPFPLPDLDSGAHFKPFAPSETKKPGLYAWLALAPGAEVMDLDKEAQERLRALGYIGPGQ